MNIVCRLYEPTFLFCWDVEEMAVAQQLDETAAKPEAAVQALTETREQVAIFLNLTKRLTWNSRQNATLA